MLQVSATTFPLAEPTLIYFLVAHSALFTVLQEATIDLRELKGEELAERAKYAELIMKVSCG